MDLREVVVEPVVTADESRRQRLIQAHHCLAALLKIGETLWYVARWHREWVAPIGFFRAGLEVLGAGRLDRPGFPGAVRPVVVGHRRQPLSAVSGFPFIGAFGVDPTWHD